MQPPKSSLISRLFSFQFCIPSGVKIIALISMRQAKPELFRHFSQMTSSCKCPFEGNSKMLWSFSFSTNKNDFLYICVMNKYDNINKSIICLLILFKEKSLPVDVHWPATATKFKYSSLKLNSTQNFSQFLDVIKIWHTIHSSTLQNLIAMIKLTLFAMDQHCLHVGQYCSPTR